VKKIHIDENPADMLTKPLSNTKFMHCLTWLVFLELSTLAVFKKQLYRFRVKGRFVGMSLISIFVCLYK
jgi:hypothetical protein